MKQFITIIVCFCLLGSSTLVAQTAQRSSTVKWKPPKTITMLGASRDTSYVIVEEGKQLVGLPLRVLDDKKNSFPISSYQFLYRRKILTEDEQTGKTSPSSSVVAQTFRVTPLPEIWVKTLKDQLQSGEELYFFDVVARDAQGKLFFAPNLLIRIK